MTRTLFALSAVALATTACVDLDADTDPTPLPPIVAPLPGDLDVPAESPMCAPLVPTTVYTYARDDAGRLVAAAQRDGAGETLIDHAFTYDEAGRLVGWASTLGGETTERTLERDAEGAITRWQIEPLGLQVEVTREADTLVLDATGTLYLDLDDTLPPGVTLAELAPDWEAVAPDMTLTVLYAAQRWADDEVTLERVLGEAHVRQVNTLGPDGRPTRKAVDVDGDGEGDIVWEEERTADTRSSRLSVALDDLPVIRTVETLDAQGEVVVSEGFEDDALTRRVTFERTAEHVIEERDDDGDGDVDQRTSLFLNANGNRILKYDDRGPDGRPDWRKRYRYDEVTGLRTFDERDSNANGFVDERWDYAYDAAGRVVEERISAPVSGNCGARW